MFVAFIVSFTLTCAAIYYLGAYGKDEEIHWAYSLCLIWPINIVME